MRRATTDAGLRLSDEQLFQLALRNGISHEYGHAVERVIVLLRGQFVPAGKKAWLERIDIKKSLEQSIFDTIAPRPELQQILEGQPTNGYAVERSRTSSERIAVGFESLGTRYTLEEMGIDSQTVDTVLKNLDQIDRGRLDQSIELVQMLQAKGLNIQDLNDAIIDIYSHLKDRGRVDVFEPLRWRLDSSLLGYFFPLTKDELQKFVSQWTPQS